MQRPAQLTLAEINRLAQQDFASRLGGIFEHSPWVAEEAREKRPFASLDQLHEAMMSVVQQAARERQLALIRAHPELTLSRGEVVWARPEPRAAKGRGQFLRCLQPRPARPRSAAGPV